MERVINPILITIISLVLMLAGIMFVVALEPRSLPGKIVSNYVYESKVSSTVDLMCSTSVSAVTTNYSTPDYETGQSVSGEADLAVMRMVVESGVQPDTLSTTQESDIITDCQII